MLKSEERYYSSDEEEWEVEVEPLLNVFSCGWTEDYRCGYSEYNNESIKMQLSPSPIINIRKCIVNVKSNEKFYICKSASAGSRHSVFLMINCRKEKGRFGRKTKKLLITGLNQRGLSEDDSILTTLEIPIHSDEIPISIAAKNGVTFIITKIGNVYSFGNGNYGMLGHNNGISTQSPAQITSLEKVSVKNIAVGRYHVLVTSYTGRLYSWGRNNKGQLGLGFENEYVELPTRVEHFHDKEPVIEISCGEEHSLVLSRTVRKDLSTQIFVFAWGDSSRGQLGSGDANYRSHPQEMRWVMNYLKKLNLQPLHIAAGGWHNLLITSSVGQVMAWGAGDYGQLGTGNMWDDARPRIIVGLKDVLHISAGLRHSAAIRTGSDPLFPEVWMWGHNSYGELGLGDTDIRLQPTRVSALDRARVRMISCGDRHSIFVTAHRPLVVREDPDLREHFSILQSGEGTNVRKFLAEDLLKKGLDPDILDHPEARLEGQPGDSENELLNDEFESGLRYCLDTLVDSHDWRRKTYETYYICPSLNLKSICIVCARNCHPLRFLQPAFKKRLKTDVCDCNRSSYCLCGWSKIREKFDEIAEADGCISPRHLRQLLVELRSPSPVDASDLDECLGALAEGTEDADTPRINAKEFEKWYKSYFQLYE